MSLTPGRSTIEVIENGPFIFSGEVRLLDPQEQPVATETRVSLCRCGQSNNKPYCDGSHADSEFCHCANALDGKVGDAPGDGPIVDVEPLANGPLFVTGAFQIVSSDGETIVEGSKTVLCRCGLSESKPFCDGSHKDGGFQAPTMGS